MYFIIGNFGNHSLAAMQALIEQNCSAVHFLLVDTGWAASQWLERVSACTFYAESQGVEVHILNAKSTFADMVRDRKQFPSPKFQWCAPFLKGLSLLNFLEEIDPACEAMIVSGKRRQDSRKYLNLLEFEENSEHYQRRTIWHPLCSLDDASFQALIERTPFAKLSHASLECSPCIHSSAITLEPECQLRLQNLEKELGKTMFSQNVSLAPDSGLQQFDRGCGAPWGCGE